MRTVWDRLAEQVISVHQILPATHCVVIVVEQKVSGHIVQSQSQGGIAEECIQYQTNLESV